MKDAQLSQVAQPNSIARSADLMSVERSCLVVIDLQERLLPVIRSSLSVASTVRFLLDAAALLHVPAVVSEQYPKGLGSTVESLADHPAVVEHIEKLTFSAATPIQQMFPRHVCLPESGPQHHVSGAGSASTADSGTSAAAGTPAFVRSTDLPIIDVDQMILCGIESHICVLQTALDLLAMGYRVSVVADGIGSRRMLDHEIALQRMRDTGCTILTSESVVFEWCQQAGTDVFRSLSQLVRGRPADRR